MFLTQNYDAYTPQDHEMWTRLYDRQMEVLANKAAGGFLDGLRQLDMHNGTIPNYAQLSERLQQTTGWGLQGVEGIVPNDVFFQLLAQRQFPVTTWIRKPEQMDYLEEPDLFHDVFGHVPLIANAEYAAFLQELGEMGLQHIDNPLAIELLSRIYWFTIEFGLIAEQGQLRIYGAGILSSPGESEFSVGAIPPKFYYNMQELFHTPYIKHRMQDRYFVIDSYSQLYTCLPELRTLLKRELALAKTFDYEDIYSYGLVIPQEFLTKAAEPSL